MSEAGPGSAANRDDPLYRSFELVKEFGLDTDDLKEFAEKVVNLRPDERFTNSWDQFKDHLAPFFDDIFATSDLSREIIAGCFQMLAEQFTDLQKDTLQNSKFVKTPENHLIAAVYIGEMADIFKKIAVNVDDPEAAERLFSCYTALSARLILIELDEGRKITDELIEDIGYSEYYTERAVGREIEREPTALDIEKLRHELLQQGAALAYNNLGISIQVAAELAGLSVEEIIDEINLHELPELFLRAELVERLNKTAMDEGVPPGTIINQALESYLLPPSNLDHDVNEDDPFFATQRKIVGNYTGEGPETDASKLDDRLYNDSDDTE